MNSAFLYSNSYEYGASSDTGLRSILAVAIRRRRLGKIPNTIARVEWNVEEKEVRVYEAIVCRNTECLLVGQRFTFKTLICFSLINSFRIGGLHYDEYTLRTRRGWRYLGLL